MERSWPLIWTWNPWEDQEDFKHPGQEGTCFVCFCIPCPVQVLVQVLQGAHSLLGFSENDRHQHHHSAAPPPSSPLWMSSVKAIWFLTNESRYNSFNQWLSQGQAPDVGFFYSQGKNTKLETPQRQQYSDFQTVFFFFLNHRGKMLSR